MLKQGDIVRGPSRHSEQVRTWVVMFYDGVSDTCVGQNARTKKPYRHLIDVSRVEKVGEFAGRIVLGADGWRRMVAA